MPESNIPDPIEPGQAEYHEEWLSAYLDDELSPTQRAIVEQRLTVDPSAQQTFSDLQRMRSLVAKLPAWSGRSVSVPVDNVKIEKATSTRGGDTTAITTDIPEVPSVDGNFHDELQLGDGRTRVAPIASTPQPQDKSVELVRGPTARGRQNIGWLKPLAVAASLLLIVGLGVMLWPSSSPWTLATSSKVSSSPQQPSSSESAPQELGDSSLFGSSNSALAPLNVESEKLAESRDGAMHDRLSYEADRPPQAAAPSPGGFGGGNAKSFNFDGDENRDAAVDLLGRTAPQTLAPQTLESPALAPPADASRRMNAEAEEEYFAGGLGGARADELQLSKSTEALSNANPGRSRELSAEPLRDKAPSANSFNDDNGSMSRGENSLRVVPGRTAPPTPQAIQLAHSASWTEAEIYTALERVAPMLKLPLGNWNTAGMAATTEPKQMAASGPLAELPVAIASQKPPSNEGSQLPELLQQQSIALTDVVAANQNQAIAGQAPLGSIQPNQPTTIALFVLRSEAEQILQAARQAGELSSDPVWITSLRTTANSIGPNQKVVLLFTPQ